MRGEQNSDYEAARQTVERTVMSLDYNTHLTVNDEGDTVRGRTEKNKYEFVEKTKAMPTQAYAWVFFLIVLGPCRSPNIGLHICTKVRSKGEKR